MNNKIYIKDWLCLKPYTDQTATDSYYLKLSNDVLKVLNQTKQTFSLQIGFEDEDLKDLACLLTSYFEDIISETNIWNSFIRLHKRLYKIQLPFFKLNEYVEEEINVQDICFLIWYFGNTAKRKIYRTI